MKTKLLASILIIALNFSLKGQITIGKEIISSNSTLLDFDDSPANVKGMILPAVTSLPQNPANGNFVFDTTDSVVKMYEGNHWVNLSENGSNIELIPNNSSEIGSGAIIGAETSLAEGILVLEAPDKAMVLPKISSPHDNVKSPYPGMICYDTVSKSLAVFDGSKWHFWK